MPLHAATLGAKDGKDRTGVRRDHSAPAPREPSLKALDRLVAGPRKPSVPTRSQIAAQVNGNPPSTSRPPSAGPPATANGGGGDTSTSPQACSPSYDTSTVTLSLHHAGLDAIPADLTTTATNIRSLDVSFNRLTTLLPLRAAHNLRELLAYGNRLASVVEIPPKLTHLARLSLIDNRLSSLVSFPTLRALRSLELSGNPLSSITGLPELPQLARLVVDRCRLTSLQGIRVLPGLEEISARDNQLTTCEHLVACPKLTEVDLSHNQLESLTGLGASYATLLTIRAGDNRLTALALPTPLVRPSDASDKGQDGKNGGGSKPGTAGFKPGTSYRSNASNPTPRTRAGTSTGVRSGTANGTGGHGGAADLAAPPTYGALLEISVPRNPLVSLPTDFGAKCPVLDTLDVADTLVRSTPERAAAFFSVLADLPELADLSATTTAGHLPTPRGPTSTSTTVPHGKRDGEARIFTLSEGEDQNDDHDDLAGDSADDPETAYRVACMRSVPQLSILDGEPLRVLRPDGDDQKENEDEESEDSHDKAGGDMTKKDGERVRESLARRSVQPPQGLGAVAGLPSRPGGRPGGGGSRPSSARPTTAQALASQRGAMGTPGSIKNPLLHQRANPTPRGASSSGRVVTAEEARGNTAVFAQNLSRFRSEMRQALDDMKGTIHSADVGDALDAFRERREEEGDYVSATPLPQVPAVEGVLRRGEKRQPRLAVPAERSGGEAVQKSSEMTASAEKRVGTGEKGEGDARGNRVTKAELTKYGPDNAMELYARLFPNVSPKKEMEDEDERGERSKELDRLTGVLDVLLGEDVPGAAELAEMITKEGEEKMERGSMVDSLTMRPTTTTTTDSAAGELDEEAKLHREMEAELARMLGEMDGDGQQDGEGSAPEEDEVDVMVQAEVEVLLGPEKRKPLRPGTLAWKQHKARHQASADVVAGDYVGGKGSIASTVIRGVGSLARVTGDIVIGHLKVAEGDGGDHTEQDSQDPAEVGARAPPVNRSRPGASGTRVAATAADDDDDDDDNEEEDWGTVDVYRADDDYDMLDVDLGLGLDADGATDEDRLAMEALQREYLEAKHALARTRDNIDLAEDDDDLDARAPVPEGGAVDLAARLDGLLTEYDHDTTGAGEKKEPPAPDATTTSAAAAMSVSSLSPTRKMRVIARPASAARMRLLDAQTRDRLTKEVAHMTTSTTTSTSTGPATTTGEEAVAGPGGAAALAAVGDMAWEDDIDLLVARQATQAGKTGEEGGGGHGSMSSSSVTTTMRVATMRPPVGVRAEVPRGAKVETVGARGEGGVLRAGRPPSAGGGKGGANLLLGGKTVAQVGAGGRRRGGMLQRREDEGKAE